MYDIILDQSWKKVLQSEFTKTYWNNLITKVDQEYLTKNIYPDQTQIFQAFNACPIDRVRVVIIGQDPYHGPGQANGLSFAVNEGMPLPPSLKNIFKEIKNDLNITPQPSGDVSRWANQGVLLLNSVLTVESHRPASHTGIGWEVFTNAVIKALGEHHSHIVYLLWGNYAQVKGQDIDREQNLVLSSSHPSPFSARHFFGHHHFSQCNAYLKEHHNLPINWS
jgi:uracil-DNA glycosylase